MNELKFAMKEAGLLHKYLLTHTKVTDVLFTGGDPLTAKANIISAYIEPLLTKEFSHIRNIRIGSKTLSYWPYRFLTDKDADDLLRLFEKVKKSWQTSCFSGSFQSSGRTFYRCCEAGCGKDTEYRCTDKDTIAALTSY